MTPKDFIKQAIFQAEKKHLPHFYSNDKEVSNIYKIFKDCIKDYYSTLLDSTKIKKISAGDGNTIYLNLEEYLSATNIKKQQTINKLLDFQKDYYKDKSNHNKIYDYVLKSLSDYGKAFVENIEDELENINNMHYVMSTDEETCINEKSLFSLNNGVRSFNDLEQGQRFQELSSQSSLMVLGQPEEYTINNWVSSFCQNAPKSMKSIGLDEKDISLGNKITFYYSHNLVNQSENAFIEYDENKKSTGYHYVSFDNTINPDVIASSILHEWTHGLDLELGKELNNKVHFISNDFMRGESIINKSHPLHNIIKMGQEEMSWALSKTDFETYNKNKQIAVKEYKKFMTETVGTIICKDIAEGWDNLSYEQKNKIQSIPEFKKLITSPLKLLRKTDAYSSRILSKSIYALINSQEYKEIFPNFEHPNITSRAKLLLNLTKEYSIDNKITWFNTKTQKSGTYENFALTNTDFALFSSVRGYMNKKEYLFYPHEIFARRVQMLALEPVNYSITPKGCKEAYALDKQNLINAGNKPEESFFEKVQLISLVQDMCQFIGIKPKEKFTTIIANNKDKYLENDLKIEQRGNLANSNLLLKKLKKINNFQSEELVEKIITETQKHNKQQVNKFKHN